MNGGRWRRVSSAATRGARSRAAARRGVVSVCVLVCLIVITIITGVLLRIGMTERRRLRAEERRLQAEWLVESGLGRGAARLAASRGEYRGETWDIAAAELGGPDAARVTIAVEPVAGDTTRRSLRVQADYPLEVSERARLSKRVVLSVASNPPGENP